MAHGCSGKNISRFFSKKIYTVFLVLFVFVMGMMAKDAFAAPDTGDLANEVGKMVGKLVGESLLFDVSEPVNSLEDQLIIEGVKNLFVAGDGAGLTRGLAQASACGVYIARNILERK